MKEPLVSVIVPVYNSEKYLNPCIDSIISQTYKNIEIILVNDGSTDNSENICKLYEKENENIKVIEKSNGGLSSARNTGIDNANGEYLTFIDSDDIVSSDMIQIMVDATIKYDADIVKIGLKRIYGNDVPISSYGETECISPYEAMRRIFIPAAKMISACGKLFNKKLFSSIRFPDGMFYEDEYTTPKLFNMSNKVVICNSELYFYMQRDNDSIIRGSLTNKKIEDSLYIGRERIDFFEKNNYMKLRKLAIYDYYYKLKKLYSETRNNKHFKNKNNEIGVEIKQFRKTHIIIYLNIICRNALYNTKRWITENGVRSRKSV